jgi:hypothetical protein
VFNRRFWASSESQLYLVLQMMSSWLEPKLPRLERFFWFALVGGIALPAGAIVKGTLGGVLSVGGILTILPLFGYLYLLPIWHWKERYRGDHSHLWGAALVIETSGWSKVAYWFRHILPDHNGRGRYSDPRDGEPGA